jgi:hypothetical protein
MAGFKTHITTSTVLGVGYAGAAVAFYDVEPTAAILAGGLCSVSGMLPDLDSGPGVPMRESIAFAAAVVPMLMIHRFKHLGMTPEMIILAGGAIYLAIRFGLSKLLKKYTVHRGMFHSLPAALIAAEIAFLLCAHWETPMTHKHGVAATAAVPIEDLAMRFFNAGAVLLGFMSHLVLDEIWSIDMKRGMPHLKSSFGTAIKFWGQCGWANVLTYACAILMTYMVLQDPVWIEDSDSPQTGANLRQMANQALQKVRK